MGGTACVIREHVTQTRQVDVIVGKICVRLHVLGDEADFIPLQQ